MATTKNFTASQSLAIETTYSDCEKDLKGFDYQTSVINDGKESADLQLERLNEAFDAARIDLQELKNSGFSWE